MEGLIAAFNTGSYNSLIWAAAMLLLSRYAVDIVTIVITNIVTGLHYLQDRANATEIGKLTDVDDKFFSKMSEAVEAVAPLAEDLKKLSSDGKLTQEDIKALQEKAWELFVDNLGVKDWLDFGASFVPGFKSKESSRAFTEASLKRKFDSMHVRAVDRVKRSRRLLDKIEDPEQLGRALRSLKP